MLTATLILAVGNDGRYLRFYQVIGRPDLGTDARFARNADRVRHRATLSLRASPARRRHRQVLAKFGLGADEVAALRRKAQSDRP